MSAILTNPQCVDRCHLFWHLTLIAKYINSLVQDSGKSVHKQQHCQWQCCCLCTEVAVDLCQAIDITSSPWIHLHMIHLSMMSRDRYSQGICNNNTGKSTQFMLNLFLKKTITSIISQHWNIKAVEIFPGVRHGPTGSMINNHVS